MKSLPAQITLFMRHKHSGRNIAVLLKFIGVLVAMITFYSVIFHFIMRYEGREYSWVSGFYWTLVTMSTLGFGDITFHSDLGKVYSMVVILSGTIFLLVMLPFTFIQFFYAPWMEAQAAARTPRSLPEGSQGHVILTSYDPVTQAFIARLTQYSLPYVILCPSADEAQRLHDMGVSVMVGDLDDPETYRLARADHASMVAATLDDAVNTNIVFTLREIAPTVPVVATARQNASIPILELAGAQPVFDLGNILGGAMARCTVGGDAITHVVGSVDELLIAEASASRTPLVGQTLRMSRLRDLGVNVVGVWDRGGFKHATPDTVIGATSILVIAGSAEQLQNYDEHFAIYNVSGEPVVVLGGGRIGMAAAAALVERGFEVRIIEQQADRVKEAARTIVGNAADVHVLERAGIRKAPAVLITTHDDNINLYLTIYCRRLRPDIQIIARATSVRNVATLSRAGADFVLSYASMGADAMFNVLRKSSLVTITEGLEVFSVRVPEALAGKTIAESRVRELTGCTIVAVRSAAGAQPAPPADQTPPPARRASDTGSTDTGSPSAAPEGARGGSRLITSPPPDLMLTDRCELVLVGDPESRAKFVDNVGR
jgi:voltage-gated potassium channel